jgi:hypothetical protein
MNSSSNRLRLFGLIQELQKEAADLGLTRTAAALEVTTAVVMEELADHAPHKGSQQQIDEDEPA